MSKITINLLRRKWSARWINSDFLFNQEKRWYLCAAYIIVFVFNKIPHLSLKTTEKRIQNVTKYSFRSNRAKGLKKIQARSGFEPMSTTAVKCSDTCHLVEDESTGSHGCC